MDLVQIGNYAAAISAVMALLTVLVYKPVKAGYTEYKRMLRESRDADKAILEQLNKLDDKVTSLTGDVQRIEGDRLAQKHRYYMSKGYCSQEEKADVCRWYEAYSNKGGNHLTATYIDDIIALPEKE